MASKSYNDIRSIAEDWQYDDRNGLKYSGKSVQKFIKGQLQEKVAATYFDAVELRLYGFRSTEDRDKYVETKDTSLIIDSCPFNFTGMQYRVVIDNLMGSTQLYFTTNQSTAIINVGFISQEKGITDFEWKDKTEDFLVSVAVDKGAQGNYVNIKTDETVLNGSTLSFDVKNLIISGANRVKVTATGKDTGATTTLVYTVTLTAMYIAPSNFTWYKPFIEGEKFSVGGLNIGGNLQKILKIRVTKEGYQKLYEVNLGSNIYTTTAYYFNDMQFPESGTGVYNLEIWVDAGGVETEHLSYNIICVSQADKDTAQLVCIGQAVDKVYNFSDNKLFDYCVYNAGAATGSPHIKVEAITNTNPSELVNEDLVDVTTGAALSYVLALEVEAEEAQLQLDVILTYGNTQQVIYPVDNSKSYPATSGASFYFNPATRNNAQENRETVINAVNGANYTATWTNMAWTDGVDGYTTDDNGRKCLRLPAGSKVSIDFKAMERVSSRTIEFIYKVKNASNYSEPCITLCDDASNPKFNGIVIRPKNILLHSNNLNVEDGLQDYNTKDEELMIVTITLVRNYKTNYGNLAQIYVNGDKKRSFEFESGDSWDNSGNIVFGSDTADTFIYKARVYDRGFEKVDAMRNYTNALPDSKAKEEFTAWNETCVDDNYSFDYDKCVKNGLNTMVIEMLGGAPLPDLLNPNKEDEERKCNLWIDIRSNKDDIDAEMAELLSGIILENQTIEGQGTTAMTYYRWNFRWKLSSAYNKRRITAKKNFASSMHSHKMGATRMLNYLYKECVGANDANADVAVTQYPVYGFLKVPIEGTDKYTYQPIGLYTIGADKGDKHTFGYDNKEFKNSLIHMEGADHTPKAVGYDYPWEQLRYDAGVEAIGAVNDKGAVVAAFEVGACGDYSTDKASDAENIKAMLDVELKPAYNVAYHNSPYIHGVPETLEQINANVVEWQKGSYNGVSYAYLEFYTHGVYDLYYYNEQHKVYMPTGINVVEDLGLDITKKTEGDIERMIIEARKARFAEQWGNYWNTKDAIFTFCFILLIAATDNFKKNLYPQKFKLLADGGKWCHRNDDLDTIWDINNQGQSDKSYSALVGDKISTGSVFRGDESVFWTLVRETQQTAIEEMMRLIFDKMCAKAREVGYNGSTRQQLIGCIKHFFWDNAQAYFPASAYNNDAEWTYEDAWAMKAYREVKPLSQALGSHYEAEQDFVAMRMLFLASYYNYGAFTPSGYNDQSEGQLVFGRADAHTFEITTAADINPVIISGQTDMFDAGERVKEGQTVSIYIPTAQADTRAYIQGLDWMSDIGDLSVFRMGAGNALLVVQSKRLKRLKVGDEDDKKVLSNVKSIEFNDCPSMLIVDARNVDSLQTISGLDKLPRLREAYFGGTSIPNVSLPEGAKIVKLQMPDNITTLELIDLKFLDSLEAKSLANVLKFRVEGCAQLDVFELLSRAYNSDDSKLRDIRITDFFADGDATDMDMLANLVNDKDKDGNEHIYNGINADGETVYYSNPVIDGTFNAVTPLYEDSLEVVTTNYPKLNINESGIYYQRFKDKEVLRVLLANNLGDGLGVIKEDWANVNNIHQWFSDNAEVASFLELALSAVTTLSSAAFRNCTSLKEIGLSKLTALPYQAFDDCASLTGDFDLPLLLSMDDYAFRRTKITSFVAPNVAYVGGSAFYACAELNTLDVRNAETIGSYVCYGCTELVSANIDKAKTIGEHAFGNCYKLTSIPLDKVTNIGTSAFRYSGLSGVINAPALATIGNMCFRETKITSFIAPKLTTIGSEAFLNCTSLTSVDMPLVESIGASAFDACTSLSGDFDLQKLISLGEYAFRRTNVNSFTAPKLSSVKLNAFAECKNLTSVSIPNLQTIDGGAFQGSGLTSFSGPFVTAIGNMAFYNCKQLASIDIQNTQSIGSQGFEECTALKGDLVFPKLTTIGARAFFNTSITSFEAQNLTICGNYTFYKCTSLTAIEVPNMQTIGNYMFSDCTSLTTIDIPNVESISIYAFSKCTSLSSVNIPNVQSIGDSAFKGCSSLSGSVSLSYLRDAGDSVFRATAIDSFIAPKISSLGITALAECKSLVLVDLGAELTSIGTAAFSDSYNLKTFICRAAVPPSLGDIVFNNTSSLLTIYVPDSAVDTYKNATGWADYASKIKGISELPTE